MCHEPFFPQLVSHLQLTTIEKGHPQRTQEKNTSNNDSQIQPKALLTYLVFATRLGPDSLSQSLNALFLITLFLISFFTAWQCIDVAACSITLSTVSLATHQSQPERSCIGSPLGGQKIQFMKSTHLAHAWWVKSISYNSLPLPWPTSTPSLELHQQLLGNLNLTHTSVSNMSFSGLHIIFLYLLLLAGLIHVTYTSLNLSII